VRILRACCITVALGTLIAPSVGRGQTACVGDCDGDGFVEINELIAGVNLELGGDSVGVCPALNCDTHFGVHIDCLIVAVTNALNGCRQPPPTPVPPHLALNLQLNDRPGQHQVDVVATLDHLGGTTVSYATGCSAQCYPQFLRPIAFVVTGRDGPVIVDNCGAPLGCAEQLVALSAGDSLHQTLSVTGTAFELHCDFIFGDNGCTETRLAPGSYAVTATFSYRIGSDWAAPEYELQETVEFNWPPGGTPPQSPSPSPTAPRVPTPVLDCGGVPDDRPCLGPCGPCHPTVSGYCAQGECRTECPPCVTPTEAPTPTPTHGCTPTLAPTFEPNGGRCRTIADCDVSQSPGACLSWEDYLARDSCQRTPAPSCDDAGGCPANFTCAPGGVCLRAPCVRDEDCDGAFCVRGRCDDELGVCGFFPP
jgi:hypothetical protein